MKNTILLTFAIITMVCIQAFAENSITTEEQTTKPIFINEDDFYPALTHQEIEEILKTKNFGTQNPEKKEKKFNIFKKLKLKHAYEK